MEERHGCGRGPLARSCSSCSLVPSVLTANTGGMCLSDGRPFSSHKDGFLLSHVVSSTMVSTSLSCILMSSESLHLMSELHFDQLRWPR